MATYKKLSEYDLNTSPNDDDLVPSIITNPDGSHYNALIPYSELKGLPGEGVPVGGSTSQVLSKASSTDRDTEWLTLTKSSVGLGNVDNTSDISKPVSTAVQEAINLAIAQAKQDQYPVGSIYFNATVNTNPSSLLGFGTWVSWGSGRVPVGVDSTQTEFDGVEETGGAKTHTLTTAEMPSHNHKLEMAGGGAGVPEWATPDTSSGSRSWSSSSQVSTTYRAGYVNSNGGGGAHNNLQPYITVYMWKRTA